MLSLSVFNYFLYIFAAEPRLIYNNFLSLMKASKVTQCPRRFFETSSPCKNNAIPGHSIVRSSEIDRFKQSGVPLLY